MLACVLSSASFASEPQKLLFKSKFFKKINLPCYPAYKFRKFEGKLVFTLVPFVCSLCCFHPLLGRDHSKKNLAPVFIY